MSLCTMTKKYCAQKDTLEKYTGLCHLVDSNPDLNIMTACKAGPLPAEQFINILSYYV